MLLCNAKCIITHFCGPLQMVAGETEEWLSQTGILTLGTIATKVGLVTINLYFNVGMC
jgi:hypothetical protein